MQSHEVQNSCMKIVYMHRIFCNIITKLIRFTVHAGLHTATGHPDRETAGMMITSIIIFCQSALAIVGTSKFATPYYQCFIEQTSLFQVSDQCGRSLRSEERRVGKEGRSRWAGGYA